LKATGGPFSNCQPSQSFSSSGKGRSSSPEKKRSWISLGTIKDVRKIPRSEANYPQAEKKGTFLRPLTKPVQVRGKPARYATVEVKNSAKSHLSLEERVHGHVGERGEKQRPGVIMEK